MARRYTGQITLGYHFAETVSAQAQIGFSPDLGEHDLKGLVDVLLQRAHDASTSNSAQFQQPLDKVVLGANFGAAWAPLYGKINLFGETVLNFDFYGFAGVGMVSKQNYAAVYDEGVDITVLGANVVRLNALGNEVKVGPALGIGQNYFITQTIAVKIDLRSSLYVDQKPQYDPQVPPDGSRLYNNLTASAGVGFFFPKMKPRLYNF
jgi:outer membrane beta-barrel protein